MKIPLTTLRYFLLAALAVLFASARTRASDATPVPSATPSARVISMPPARVISAQAPANLPGKGLAEHDFFYAGEQKERNMYIVRKGEVVWSYLDATGRGEISDATLLSNGNVLFAHQYGVTLIDSSKKVLWNHDAPAGYEIHTAQPIGKEHVIFIQNGPEPKLFVMNTATGATEKEMPLTVKNPKSTHGQFRHARLTAAGTYLVEHMDLSKAVEYDESGRVIWSFDIVSPGSWAAMRLENGNTLITTRFLVYEVDPKGVMVWEYNSAETPAYKIAQFQLASRLPNGNTLVNNWANQWQDQIDQSNAPVQALEITPDKKVAWALRAWMGPANLGPSTTIQLLDDPAVVPENVHFGDIH